MDRRKQFEIADAICDKLEKESDVMVGKFVLACPAFLGLNGSQARLISETQGLFPLDITPAEQQTITDIVLGQRPALMQKIRQSSR